MAFKSILGATCAGLVFFSSNASAAVVSADWNNLGDNLITQDTVSGLNWLDLTETNGLSYDYVSGQLGTGGQYEGFRYATDSEVVALWANWGVNLATGASGSISGPDSNVQGAASTLGNIFPEASNQYLAGALGITIDSPATGNRSQLGAFITFNPTNTYYYLDGSYAQLDSNALVYSGSYLVETAVVPIPAAVWLFGSGLIGLIGIARRKKA